MGSDLEEEMAFQIRVHALPEPAREHAFHPDRKWRFDFAWPALRVALEVEGGTWSRGRHTRGKGYEADAEKYGAAAAAGWEVVRVTGAQVKSGAARDIIAAVLARHAR